MDDGQFKLTFVNLFHEHPANGSNATQTCTGARHEPLVINQVTDKGEAFPALILEATTQTDTIVFTSASTQTEENCTISTSKKCSISTQTEVSQSYLTK